MKGYRFFIVFIVLIASMAISQVSRAYEVRGSCYGNNLSTVTACCNDGCEGTNYWSGCYVYDPWAEGYNTSSHYYCECFAHLGSPNCTPTCTDACDSGETGCNSTKTKRYTCQDTNDDGCLEKSYTSCSTGNYCSSGSCVACSNECSSGQTGCNGTGQSWSCTQNSTGCWVKTYTSCSTGYVCSSGQCIFSGCTDECTSGVSTCSSSTQLVSCGEALDGDVCLDKIYSNCPSGQICSVGLCITPSTPPVISGNYFDQLSKVVTFKLTDSTGVVPQQVVLYLYNASLNYITYYNMVQSVGTDPKLGIWYTSNFSSLADGTYNYTLAVVSHSMVFYYPSSGYYQFTKTSCTDECTSGSSGCNGTGQRWSCGEANDNDICLDKVYTNCNTGYICSSGNCIPNCSNECTSGQIGCNSTTQRWTCGENDSDPCLDRVLTNCQSGYQCSSGTCGCTPNWTCGSWTSCVNNNQTRTCTDSNNCSVNTNKPATSQYCCVSDCTQGYHTCNSLTSQWACRQGTGADTCWHKTLETCSSGYYCWNSDVGACQDPHPSAPVIYVAPTQVHYWEPYNLNISDVKATGYGFYEALDSGFLNITQSRSNVTRTFSFGPDHPEGTTFYYKAWAYNYFNSTYFYSPFSNMVSEKIVEEPVIVTIKVIPDVLAVCEETAVTVSESKNVGFEIGFGDGEGFSFGLMPTSPILHYYDAPGIYKIVVKSFTNNGEVITAAYAVVITDIDTYREYADFSWSEYIDYETQLNTTITNQASQRLGGN